MKLGSSLNDVHDSVRFFRSRDRQGAVLRPAPYRSEPKNGVHLVRSRLLERRTGVVRARTVNPIRAASIELREVAAVQKVERVARHLHLTTVPQVESLGDFETEDVDGQLLELTLASRRIVEADARRQRV